MMNDKWWNDELGDFGVSSLSFIHLHAILILLKIG
jgi:hypothetical protein